jgi:UDP:flavonoid glycosyltransferase YjiC (YdhE family)
MQGERRVVLATFGSHGDLHPFLAMALCLRQHRITPVLAAADLYRDKVQAEGIEFRHMRPDPQDVMQRLGLSQSQLLRCVRRHPRFLLREMLLPHLEQTYQDSLQALRGADLVVTHSAAYGARLAAEKLGVPCLGIALQPLMFMSAFDPPLLGPLPAVSRCIYSLGPFWTRKFLNLGKRIAQRWAAPIAELRRSIGLPPVSDPLFAGQFTGLGTIALYSSVLGELQPDMPPGTHITGFACYDREYGRPTPLSHSVINFLAEEPRPLIFTLGTAVIHDADQFMEHSLAAVRTLRARAIFILDAEQRTRWSKCASRDIMITSYVPYSLLFPHGELIVHHGGIGTLAQALRAGRPQLVVPHLVDQPDNAQRVTRLGVARTLPARQLQHARLVEELQQLLSEPSYRDRAVAVAEQVRRENGADAAARIIVDVLTGLQPAVVSPDVESPM